MIIEADQLYGKDNWTLHQDSAPAHTAKKTQKFLMDAHVQYITPSQWMPNSPDCSPCDYWLFPMLENKVKKKNIKSIAGLKRAIVGEVKKISIDQVEKALAAWPRRVLKVHQAKAGHIEKLGAKL